jgi:acetyltransferase-like isoleucine patch superfamily enzyme
LRRVRYLTVKDLEKLRSEGKRQRQRAYWPDPLEIFRRGVNRLLTLWLKSTYPFESLGPKLSVQFPLRLDRNSATRIKVGASVTIGKDVWLNVPVKGGDEVKIILGDRCSLGPRNILSAKNLIHIEKDVIFATSVLIQDHSHAYEDVRVPIKDQGITAGGRIRIEQGCWIGQGVAIVCNEGELVIGRNSVIAANALVTRSFLPYSVIVGNPARLARKFDIALGKWIGGGDGQAAPSGPQE